MVLRRRLSTRAKLERLVDRLELPDDWTAEEFFAALELMRGRRIVRLTLPGSAAVGLCGLWLACDDVDLILHRPASNPSMERHVIGHEVGHMLLDHGRDAPMPTEELADLLTGVELGHNIDMLAVRAARGASSYATKEEYEAELLATLILTRARREGATRRDLVLKALTIGT